MDDAQKEALKLRKLIKALVIPLVEDIYDWPYAERLDILFEMIARRAKRKIAKKPNPCCLQRIRMYCPSLLAIRLISFAALSLPKFTSREMIYDATVLKVSAQMRNSW